MTTRPLLQLAALAATLVVMSACEDDPTTVESPVAFTITSGACGDLIFQENLGDSASALAEIESRTAEQFPTLELAFALFKVEVVDEDGQVPEPRFYGVLLRDAVTGSQFAAPRTSSTPRAIYSGSGGVPIRPDVYASFRVFRPRIWPTAVFSYFRVRQRLDDRLLCRHARTSTVPSPNR